MIFGSFDHMRGRKLTKFLMVLLEPSRMVAKCRADDTNTLIISINETLPPNDGSTDPVEIPSKTIEVRSNGVVITHDHWLERKIETFLGE
tara:strand:+ start:656 stop:925 length:270 start_codon:yes stop_codon:yes gene_type:complete